MCHNYQLFKKKKKKLQILQCWLQTTFLSVRFKLWFMQTSTALLNISKTPIFTYKLLKKYWQAVTKAQNRQEWTIRQKGEGRRVDKLRLLEWALWDRKKKLHYKTERTMMTMRQKGQGSTDTEKTRMHWGRNDCTSIFYVNLFLWYILDRTVRVTQGYTIRRVLMCVCVCVCVLKFTAYVIHCGSIGEEWKKESKFCHGNNTLGSPPSSFEEKWHQNCTTPCTETGIKSHTLSFVRPLVYSIITRIGHY